MIYSAARDVTENKRAEAEAFQARVQLFSVGPVIADGELTASLAHELNQPLAAILSNAQAGSASYSQANRSRRTPEILQDITQDDQRAGSVIRSLRSMVKREIVERKPVILNDVLNDVVQIFHTESFSETFVLKPSFMGRYHRSWGRGAVTAGSAQSHP